MSTPEAETFVASRWTAGNFLFPTRIVVNAQRVSRVKPGLLSSNEQSIPIPQVASVHILTGILWADVRIESAGGSDPITSHGHRKEDAMRIRDLIESYQSSRRS